MCVSVCVCVCVRACVLCVCVGCALYMIKPQAIFLLPAPISQNSANSQPDY